MAGVEAAGSLWQGQVAAHVRQCQAVWPEHKVEHFSKAMEYVLRLGGETSRKLAAVHKQLIVFVAIPILLGQHGKPHQVALGSSLPAVVIRVTT